MEESLTTKASASKCDELSTARIDSLEAKRLAATAWQLCREALSFTADESDELLRYRLGELQEIIFEVGPERFHLAIKRCLRIYSKPWEMTVANIRREAGLDCSPAKLPYVEAWEKVTEVVRKHLCRDANGHLHIEDRITLVDGYVKTFPVPVLSHEILAAVMAMGGWASLLESHPQYWSIRLTQFKEIYQP